MTEVQKELDLVFKLISSIPVSGDAVDALASARTRLRAAYKLAGEREDGKDG